MKKGYTIVNDIHACDLAIIVSNYKSPNEVYNWGLETIADAEEVKSKPNDIGMWKIKRKNNEIR